MDRENVVHLHNELLTAVRKKNNDSLKFDSKWMELEKKIILSEVTQIQKDKHGTYSIISINIHNQSRYKAKDNQITIHNFREAK